MKNLNICPETILRVVLPAQDIPDGAQVTKLTGEQVLTLRHNLVLYQSEKGQEAVMVEGCFIVNGRAQITQVKPEQKLCWVVTAEDFMGCIEHSWEDPQ
jgi:hypothetical protein